MNYPIKCPICEGCGNVPTGFYTRGTTTTSTINELCRTCGGQGIIWTREDMTNAK